jgi:hypothetical protein
VSSVSMYNTFNFSAANDTIFFSFVDIIDFTLQRRDDSPVLVLLPYNMATASRHYVSNNSIYSMQETLPHRV